MKGNAWRERLVITVLLDCTLNSSSAGETDTIFIQQNLHRGVLRDEALYRSKLEEQRQAAAGAQPRSAL